MTRKEKNFIISQIKKAYKYYQQDLEKYFDNKTEKNKENYEFWERQFVTLEIMANNLGINIKSGVENRLTEEEMKYWKKRSFIKQQTIFSKKNIK